MGSLIQTDMVIEICTIAVIHGRYVDAPPPELCYQCLVMNGTCRGPGIAADLTVELFY